ncbi:MAG: hypothetical protein Q8K36_05010, partial [Alphaproteobacteria bacterium]|nr:hypothetical protein [Alphaproteobacteria bacterium]
KMYKKYLLTLVCVSSMAFSAKASTLLEREVDKMIANKSLDVALINIVVTFKETFGKFVTYEQGEALKQIKAKIANYLIGRDKDATQAIDHAHADCTAQEARTRRNVTILKQMETARARALRQQERAQHNGEDELVRRTLENAMAQQLARAEKNPVHHNVDKA